MEDGKHFMPQTNFEPKRFYGKAGSQGGSSWISQYRCSQAFSTLPTIHMAGPTLSISSPTVRIVTSLRTRNIRLLIYLDDILIVGSGQVLDLLQSLGFIINIEKSVLTPSPVMEFLELLVDFRTMMFYLQSHKVTKTIELCNALLQNRTVSLRELAQLLGFLESTRPAVWLAPLHFRHLQYCLIQQLARNKGSYDGLVCLQLLAKGELQWWISNIHQVNGSLIHPLSCEMTITSDASKLDWGAACGLQTAKGSWSSQERSLHINILELKAGFLAIQSFLKHKTNMSIKLRLDNTTAVFYINNKGGTHSPELMALTLELWTWCQQRHSHSSRTSARSTELPGGQSIEDMHRLGRLEAPTTTHQRVPGRQGHRPLCYEADAPVTTLCQLAPRSESHRRRFIFPKLGHFEGLRLSPVQSNTTNSNQSSERQNHHYPSGPSVERADLVAFTTSTGNPTASSPTFNTRNTEELRRSNSDASNVPTTISASVLKSTNKTYDSLWQKWNGWCDRRQIDPISAGLNNVPTFLSEQFESNFQYRTVNVLRSAISSTHQSVDGKPIGQHLLVILLLKGISNERPPRPRYTTTWDVSKVTSYLSSLGDNKTLSLKQLSKKLAMLLALISPERSSVLADLNTRYLKKHPDGFTFLLTIPRKTGNSTSES